MANNPLDPNNLAGPRQPPDPQPIARNHLKAGAQRRAASGTAEAGQQAVQQYNPNRSVAVERPAAPQTPVPRLTRPVPAQEPPGREAPEDRALRGERAAPRPTDPLHPAPVNFPPGTPSRPKQR